MEQSESILNTPDEVKADVLRLAGWKTGTEGLLWYQSSDGHGGTYLTLNDAYRIEVNRQKLRQACEAQCPACEFKGGIVRDMLGYCDSCTRKIDSIDFVHKVNGADMCAFCARKAGHFDKPSEPQPPSPASAGYPYAEEGYLGARNAVVEKRQTGIEKVFADWLQALKNAEAARSDLAAATRNLNAYRPAVNSPVVLFAHATLYVLVFGSDNGIEYEVAVSAEQVQQAHEDIPF
jgi:hypothetical protein